MASSFGEIKNSLIKLNWDLKRINPINIDILNKLDKYATRNNEDIYVKPRILLVNVNKISDDKLNKIKQVIEKSCIDIIWIMEIWHEPPQFNGFNSFTVSDVYKNTLYVRANLCRNRLIKEIPYGLRLDDFHFRYIKPNSNKTELFINEFGDFNFNSNKWIKNDNFAIEKRNNNPGCMGFRTEYNKEFYFIEFSKDHDMVIIEIKEKWKKYLLNDRFKLENEINDIEDKKKLGYIFKISNKYKYPKINKKIVDPIRNNLDLRPWYNLYEHDPNKIDNKGYKPIVSYGSSLHTISSKAYDVNNISNKMVLDILTKKNHDTIEKFVEINDGEFKCKTICLIKRNKEPNTVMNLRPIQVNPINFKIAEQSREALKDWLVKYTDRRIYSFIPGLSCTVFMNGLKEIVYNNG